MIELKRGNDQVVQLPNLRVKRTQTPLNSATVKATLLDPKGAIVPGFSNQTMAYVAASSGTYEWLINGPTMMLPISSLYKLVVSAVQGEYNFRAVYEVAVVD